MINIIVSIKTLIIYTIMQKEKSQELESKSFSNKSKRHR